MNDIIELLLCADNQEYIGEPISQLQHALQAAYFAQRSGADEPMILAALLHDIGHLIGYDQIDSVFDLGCKNHEDLGANFLLERGASLAIAELVRSHVDAKRYLVYKNARYRAKLSPASAKTLLHQGGPMTSEEALAFESHPLFRSKIALRNFDERAKVAGLEVPPLKSYQYLLERHFYAQ